MRKPQVVAEWHEDTAQGRPAPLFGVPRAAQVAGLAAPSSITRAEIMRRARTWVDAKVPYDMGRYWRDGYRQDCSGFVSMAWRLGSSEWTGSLDRFAERRPRGDLEAGDVLLFHNAGNPGAGSHVVLFAGWLDGKHTRYLAYEQTRPHTIARATPYAYWNNSAGYVPYRRKGLSRAPGSGTPGSAFPGARFFGLGQVNAHVERLGRQLARRGFGRHYTSGPGPRWSEADRRNVEAFQRAQGWSRADADGYPGPETWRRLFS
ncbi:peptidoglycan-binding protein [Streptomyces sp. NPDC002073]